MPGQEEWVLVGGFIVALTLDTVDFAHDLDEAALDLVREAELPNQAIKARPQGDAFQHQGHGRLQRPAHLLQGDRVGVDGERASVVHYRRCRDVTQGFFQGYFRGEVERDRLIQCLENPGVSSGDSFGGSPPLRRHDAKVWACGPEQPVARNLGPGLLTRVPRNQEQVTHAEEDCPDLPCPATALVEEPANGEEAQRSHVISTVVPAQRTGAFLIPMAAAIA